MPCKKSYNLSKMNPSRLSQLYFIACDRIHQVVDDLYEAIHTEAGVALKNKESVDSAVNEVKTAIYQELDLIKTAADEHEDHNEEA